ncbi:hypothetical protein BTU51_0264 [Rickettsia rickettsii]|uniref:Uncharacterized protein n=1 Tax=Rickettsia rickettsii (strain Iowa) TaxID=452659 RepID=B0BWE9_RICRO|nr:hypothetical protein RrIowa_0264 [Rickettsia rickettsii str. Iowa]APU55127.1 hypothetical protein BTU50_0264 [Rickettsia rickettsii]APU56504.1 hypothetical protein BTU51_0264 [Rickettsia rickettsii]
MYGYFIQYVTSVAILKLFFWIPAYAGMTSSRFSDPCNNADLIAGSS